MAALFIGILIALRLPVLQRRLGWVTQPELLGRAQAEIMVRVGISAAHKSGESIGYSLDGGHTWQPTAAWPDAASRAGTVAVSADGDTWIWTPEREAAYITRDHGATWTAVQGLPAGMRVISDPENPRTFYASRSPRSSSTGAMTAALLLLLDR